MKCRKNIHRKIRGSSIQSFKKGLKQSRKGYGTINQTTWQKCLYCSFQLDYKISKEISSRKASLCGIARSTAKSSNRVPYVAEFLLHSVNKLCVGLTNSLRIEKPSNNLWIRNRHPQLTTSWQQGVSLTSRLCGFVRCFGSRMVLESSTNLPRWQYDSKPQILRRGSSKWNKTW